MFRGILEGGRCRGRLRKCWTDNIRERTSRTAYAGTAHRGLSQKRLEEAFCWHTPQVFNDPNRRETALNCKRYDLPTVSGCFFDYELKASNQTGDLIFVPNYSATRWQIYFRLSSLARQNSNLKRYSFGRIILHYEWISSLLLPVAKRTRGQWFFFGHNVTSLSVKLWRTQFIV